MKKSALLLILCCMFPHCATIMNGTTQSIIFKSEPAGASVTVDRMFIGKTPTAAALSRSDTHTVEIDLDGYEKAGFVINKKVSKWVWGNILLGGVIGLVVDLVTGGIYVLNPEEIGAELSKNGMAAEINSDTIYIFTTLTPLENWKKIAELERK